MSSTREHRAKAEQLLEEAHTTQDQISRSLILAEAQVHATLALSAPPGASPPNRGRTQTGGTAGTRGRLPGWPEGSSDSGPQPHASHGETVRGRRYPEGQDPRRQAEERRVSARTAPPPVPASPYDPEPSPPMPARPSPRKRPEEQPQEEEPGPEGQSPAAGDLGEQDPGGPTPFR